MLCRTGCSLFFGLRLHIRSSTWSQVILKRVLDSQLIRGWTVITLTAFRELGVGGSYGAARSGSGRLSCYSLRRMPNTVRSKAFWLKQVVNKAFRRANVAQRQASLKQPKPNGFPNDGDAHGGRRSISSNSASLPQVICQPAANAADCGEAGPRRHICCSFGSYNGEVPLGANRSAGRRHMRFVISNGERCLLGRNAEQQDRVRLKSRTTNVQDMRRNTEVCGH
ncbi:unnamed protein product [Cercospora beticola]|nr:unnamed protein product [Cercospora beticola]